MLAPVANVLHVDTPTTLTTDNLLISQALEDSVVRDVVSRSAAPLPSTRQHYVLSTTTNSFRELITVTNYNSRVCDVSAHSSGCVVNGYNAMDQLYSVCTADSSLYCPDALYTHVSNNLWPWQHCSTYLYSYHYIFRPPLALGLSLQLSLQ